ncbi:MAG: aminotransferase class V-fold PLP-dependent enzyme [Planctomycetes bacterium]|nr:aminotransferase class V-fold PLP-dependent enzyme [Planctomycetota bacterium]
MTDAQRIYLDNAATSWPKPDTVYDAVQHAMRTLGAPAGRGVYHEANEVERLVGDARRRIAAFIGAKHSNHIIFTFNGTDSLNMALFGVLRPGDHVVTSVVEHNSVLRPLRQLQTEHEISVTRVRCDSTGIINPDDIRAAIRPDSRLIAITHASNVTGAIQPVEEIGRIAANSDVLFLVDAAQSLGHIPVDVHQMNAQLVAAPGHKGLLGPLGTGILYIAESVEDQISPLRFGGTGTQSDEDRQPDSMPDKFESGNLNVPAIAGLAAGVEFLENQGALEVRQHKRTLTEQLLDGLRSIDSVEVYGPSDIEKQVGVVSFKLAGLAPQELAMLLDTTYSIQVRSGMHCAPMMHQALGTADDGGTVRINPGVFTTAADLHTAIQAIAEIAAAVNV